MFHNGANAVVVLTQDGVPLAVPGFPPHPLLAPGSPALSFAARRVTDGDDFVSFLCPPRSGAPGEEHLRITVIRFRPPRDGMAAVVAVSSPGDLRGLTPRELEVVGYLVEGWSNRRIATRLLVAERTVASHVEHILAKLAAPSRVLAAVRALRQGLYVPAAFTGHSEDADTDATD